MRLKIDNRTVQLRGHGRSLGELLPGIDATCVVNGQFLKDWQEYRPDDHDEIVLAPRAGFAIPAIVQLIIQIAMAVLSMVLQMVLAPKPKPPSSMKKSA